VIRQPAVLRCVAVHFLYVDESGKSGFHDPEQPFFVLGGLAIHDTQWIPMEHDLNDRIDALVPPPRAHEWELHMADMFHGNRRFKGVPRAIRRGLWEAVLDVLDQHEATLIFIAIDKEALRTKDRYPSPPETIANRYMMERFNTFLGRRDDKIGLIVSDDQKGAEDTIRRAHSEYRRFGTGYAVIDHVIETPFFAPSHWSRMLQVIDVATLVLQPAASSGTPRARHTPRVGADRATARHVSRLRGVWVDIPEVVGGRWGRPWGTARARSPI
jgi:Protein of unknown function (DUF3800)